MKQIKQLMISLIISSILIMSVQAELPVVDVVGTELPSFVKNLFGDERINIHITMNDGNSKLYGLITQDGVVTDFQDSLVDDPTINTYATEQVVLDITSSENPLASFQQALDNDQITYSAVGIGKKIKFGITSILIKIAGWFGLGNEDSGSAMAGAAVDAGILQDEAASDADDSDADDNIETDDINEENEESSESEQVEEDEIGENEDSDENEDSSDTEEETVQEDELSKEEAKEDNSEEGVHYVELKEDGIYPKELTIKVGDTVSWLNKRRLSPTKAMIIGVRNCAEVRSGLFEHTEKFSWTFEEAGTCTIVDGVYTTLDSKVIITE